MLDNLSPSVGCGKWEQGQMMAGGWRGRREGLSGASRQADRGAPSLLEAGVRLREGIPPGRVRPLKIPSSVCSSAIRPPRLPILRQAGASLGLPPPGCCKGAHGSVRTSLLRPQLLWLHRLSPTYRRHPAWELLPFRCVGGQGAIRRNGGGGSSRSKGQRWGGRQGGRNDKG